MRRLQILNITPSNNSAVPAKIEVGLDFTSIFHGKEWIDANGTRYPFYTYDNDPATAAPVVPAGTVLLVATTFDIVENTKYAGRYTVYTKPGSNGLASSEYDSGTGNTIIRVNEAMAAGTGTELTTGYVTHVSTYMLTVTGESNLVVLEQADKSDRPVEIIGRLSVGWGEVIMQNLLRQAQSFAGPSAPDKPFQGQLWFDTINNLLKIKPTALNNNDWAVVNSSFFGTPYRHTQSDGDTTWTVTHNLGLPSPYHASCDFFVNTVNGVKPILPIDVSFVDGNNMTVTFSNAETGYVVVRA